MNKTWMGLVGMGCLALIVTGCGVVAPENQPILDDTAAIQMVPTEEAETSLIEPNAEVARATSSPITLPDIPQPVNELADGEYSWSQLLARDAIIPIYDPQFVPADQAPYEDNEMVIGVEINGEPKAYAIGPLNSREMVNDTVGGVPVLVTW